MSVVRAKGDGFDYRSHVLRKKGVLETSPLPLVQSINREDSLHLRLAISIVMSKLLAE